MTVLQNLTEVTKEDQQKTIRIPGVNEVNILGGK